MKQDKTGRYKVVLTIDPLTIKVGAQGDEVRTNVPFMMEVSVLWEPRIKPCEDDPGANEYMEIISARTFVPLILHNDKGVSLTIQPSVNIVDLINDYQYQQLVDLVYAQGDCNAY